MSLEFEWDARRASANLKKHGVTFEEAVSVFGDVSAALLPDEDHSADERRELLIGHSRKRRLLIVAFTERGPRVRITNARRATQSERTAYEENWPQ